MFTIWGDILFDKPAVLCSSTSVYVRVLDFSLADAPAKIIVEKKLLNPTLKKEPVDRTLYSLQCPKLDKSRMYTMDVHVDITGDGDVSKGDYITMESYPVKSDSDIRIDLKVRSIK